MIKKKAIWILAGLAILVTIVLILFWPKQSSFSDKKLIIDSLPEGQFILVNAIPEFSSVQKGDVSKYIIQVLYDPDKISGIDGDRLDNSIDFAPFEIRNVEKIEFKLDSGMRVYQKNYEIQLVKGEVAHLYSFPTVVVRYKLKDVDAFADTSVTPGPIYIAPRSSGDESDIISNLELGYETVNPIHGEIKDIGQSRMTWILFSLGGFLALLAVADLILRVIPQWKEKGKQVKKIDTDNVVYQSYRSIQEKVATGATPQNILHQMDHVLSVILAQEEKVDWLEEPDLELVSSGIKPTVISLFGKCKKSYGTEDIKQEEVEEAIKMLDDILDFYYAEELELWKSYPDT